MFRNHLARLALVGSVVMGCSDATQPVSPVELSAINGNSANNGFVPTLGFNGLNSQATLSSGHVITTQTDNMAMEAVVRWNGPNALHNGESIIYNGHSAVTGWGIFLIDGYVGVLAGGIDIPMSPLRLTPGVKHYVYVQRVDGIVTVMVDDQVHVLGGLGVNPISNFPGISRTSIGAAGNPCCGGDFFNGSIDKVTVYNLNSHTVIEGWNFVFGSGTTSVGRNGTVLNLINTAWVPRP